MTAMSNQFAIQAGPLIRGSTEVPVPPRNAASGPPIVTTQTAQTTAHQQASAAAQTAIMRPIALFANPSYRFDPTTDFVVIEFHDGTGAINNTIPTQRQLEAYRTHQAVPPGEPTAVPSDGKTASG